MSSLMLVRIRHGLLKGERKLAGQESVASDVKVGERERIVVMLHRDTDGDLVMGIRDRDERYVIFGAGIVWFISCRNDGWLLPAQVA